MAQQSLQRIVLSDAWTFRQAGQESWLPVRRVPTNVHLDLIDNGIIKDPFPDFNELQCQWVGEKSWIYRRILPHASTLGTKQKHVLVLEGLDTFATVRLDGTVILKSDNMWHTHRLDISHLLVADKDAVLEITFESALFEGRRIKDSHPEHRWVGFNGDMSRLAVRKAQYHWGWDWGPVLMTCGPWRDVCLESYTARLEHLRMDYKLDTSERRVQGTLNVAVDSESGGRVCFKILQDGVEVFQHELVTRSSGQVTHGFELNDVQLWYPHGYGQQALYTVLAELYVGDGDSATPMHSISHRTGFRTSELIQTPDKSGKSFYFRINGVDIFCGGSDWIPADSFTPRISQDRYRSWLQTLVDGHQVMVRVWGGGIWEHDDFYDICDELGVLVWQDFMFGCGNYPAFPEFLQSVERECATQTIRLRHHPAMTIYAGNNEDYQVQEQCGLEYNYEDKDPKSWLRTTFPARYIYEKLLPDIVAKHTQHVPYHPGSPWGDGKISSDPTVGDMHQWNVWHGTQEKFQIFDTLGGRFNSEFGMEGFPHIDTIKAFVSDLARLFPQSHVMDFHNKADGHERRLATYLVENFRIGSYDLATYVHLTQLAQADALMYGYRGWRRQWGQDRHCGGALVWQLNDCWPTISWAIIDYYQRKKPAYYAMRRALAPVSVAVKREHHDWSVVHARPASTLRFECWVSSSKVEDVEATVEIRFLSIASGDDIKDKILLRGLKITANSSTDVASGVINNDLEEPHVLAARLWVYGDIVSRDVDWPQPLKYLDMSDRQVEAVQRCDDKTGVTHLVVKAERPTKGFVIEEREGVLLDDSAIDIMPGDAQVVTITGLPKDSSSLGWTYLGAP